MRANTELLFEEITEQVIGAFFDVYNTLGYGFLEVVYQRAMPVALQQRGLACAREVDFTVRYGGVAVGEYRADLIVENKVVIETKTVAKISLHHEMQIFNYLKASNLRVGLVLNFGPKATFQRYILPERAKQSA